MKPDTIGRAIRCIGVAGAVLLIATSAGLGAYFGYTAGAHVHAAIGVAFAAAALGGEMLKPLAVVGAFESAKLRQWGRALACAVLAAVCVVYSVAAELSLSASGRGDLVAARRASVELEAAAKARASRAEADLAVLAPARPASVVAPLIAKLRAAPGGDECDAPKSAAGRKVCASIAELQSEAAGSEHRAALESAIADARSVSRGGGPAIGEADALAAALAAYGRAVGFAVEADRLAPWLALIPVLFLEFGSALALVVVRALPGAATGPDTPATAPASGNSGPDSSGGGTRRTVARPARPRLGAQVVELLKARGGTLEGGQRGLAKMLGLSKSRANELLKHLAAAGEVVVSTSRTGTRVQLASAA